MTSVSPPRVPPAAERPPGRRRRFRWNAWNLLLLIPVFVLFTPLYNRVDPKLLGMPFFYWFQLVSVFVGVFITTVVYLATKDDGVVTNRPDEETTR